MKNTQASHPPSSQEPAAPQGGGIDALCALLSLLFGDVIAGLIARLQDIFEAWRAGTLPPIPPRAPVIHAPRAPAIQTQRLRGSQHHTLVRRHAPILRIPARIRRAAEITWHALTPRALTNPQAPPPVIFFKNRFLGAHLRTPILLRYRN